MKRKINIIGLTLFFSLTLFSLAFSEESMTITTYYPSPYGSYNELTTAGNTYLATTSGKVGIGTTSPGGRVSIYDSTPTQPPLLIDRGYDGARIHFAYAGYDTTGAAGMTFYQAGKVSLWMGANLKGTAASHTGPLQANIAGPSWYTEYNTINDYFAINRVAAGGGSSTPFYINSSGNVGIGTATVDQRLDVYAPGAGATVIKIKADQNNYPNAGLNNLGGIQFAVDGAGASRPVIGEIRAFQDSGYYGLRFLTYRVGGLQDSMIVDKSGNVGIGTTGPGEKLEVNGAIKFTGDGSVISRAPRVVETRDTRAGCPPAYTANTNIFTQSYTTSRPATVRTIVNIIACTGGRHDLYFLVDGVEKDRTLASPNGAGGDCWVGMQLESAYTVATGAHTVAVRGTATNTYGCGSTWGHISSVIFE